MDLETLQAVVELGRHRTLARAARALGITQPSLTRRLQQLERELNCRLFDRGRDGAHPTPAGREFLGRAQSLLREAAALAESAQAAASGQGTDLSVAMGTYVADVVGTDALAQLIVECPRLRISLRVFDWRRCMAGVLEDMVDFGVCELVEAATHSGLECRPLIDTPLVFCARASHPLAAWRRLDLARIFEYPIGGTIAPARITHFLPADLGPAGRLDPRTGDFVPAVQVDHVHALLAIMRASDVIGAVTRGMVDDYVRRNELVVLPFAAPWLRLNAGIIRRKGRTSSGAAEALQRGLARTWKKYQRREMQLWSPQVRSRVRQAKAHSI